jgi:hypothetical protein
VLGHDKVAAALADPETADLSARVKAMLRLLTKVTQDHEALTADGVREGLAVAWAFNVITRLADAFEFEVGPPASFEAGAKQLLTRGYK